MGPDFYGSEECLGKVVRESLKGGKNRKKKENAKERLKRKLERVEEKVSRNEECPGKVKK